MLKLVMEAQKRFQKDASVDDAERELKGMVAMVRSRKSLPLIARTGPIEWSDEGDELLATAEIHLIKERPLNAQTAKRQFEVGVMQAHKACRELGWTAGSTMLVSPQGSRMIKLDVPAFFSGRVTQDWSGVVLPDLTVDALSAHFGGMFGAGPYIRLIHDAARAAFASKFEDRHHVLLHGEAATGKSSLFLAFLSWYGERLIWRVDAGTLTKAGLEDRLISMAESGTLKPFLLIEEAEKGHEANFNALLQVMDKRGRIQRTNFRDKDVWVSCPIVVWMTCNNLAKLARFQEGALLSRLPVSLAFKRPDQAMMYKILAKKAVERGHEIAWVDRVVEYMYGALRNRPGFERRWNDPRLGLFLLSGGPRLMDAGPEGFIADFEAATKGDV